MDPCGITKDLVVLTLCLSRRRAVLMLFIPVQTIGAPERPQFIVVAQVVLVALEVVWEVHQVVRIIEQGALSTSAFRNVLVHALLGGHIVMQS